MLGKNNVKGKISKAAPKSHRFAIRKLTIGAASVLISSLLWLGTSNVQAAGVEAGKTEVAGELVQAGKRSKTDQRADNKPAKAESAGVRNLKLNLKAAPSSKSSAAAKAPAKPAGASSKAKNDKPKAAAETKLKIKNVKADHLTADELKDSKIPKPNKIVDHNSAFIMKHGGTAIGEHDNVDVNGGYDENVWGKLNVNDWDYQSVNDPRNPNVKLKIKDYKGKAAGTSSYGQKYYHIVVPNSVDLINAGLLKKGQELGVDYLNDTVTVKDVDGNTNQLDGLVQGGGTYAISKTGNGKLVLLNNTFLDPNRNINYMIMRESPASLPWGSSQFCHSLTALTDLSNLDTHNITKVDFQNSCSNVVLPNMVWDLSGWDVSHVTDLEVPMFSAGSGEFILKGLDLSGWDLSHADKSKWTYGTEAPILLWAGSGRTIVNDLDLSNVKLPTNWPAYNSESGETVQSSAWIPELNAIFDEIGEGIPIPLEYLNVSYDDFTGLTSAQATNFLNRHNEMNDWENVSIPMVRQGEQIFAYHVKGIPDLSASSRFNSAYQPTDFIEGNSIPFTADNGHGTKVRIYTDNDNLLKSFGSGNYAEMKTPVASGKRTIIFNLPTGRQTKTQTVAFKNKPIYIDNDTKTIYFVVVADDPADGKYPAVDVPQVPGYDASVTESRIAAADAKPSDNIIITVNYVKKPGKKGHQDDNPVVPPVDPADSDHNDPSAASAEPSNSAKASAQTDHHQSASAADAAQAAQQSPATGANKFLKSGQQAISGRILQVKKRAEPSAKKGRAYAAMPLCLQSQRLASATSLASHQSQLPQTGERGNALGRTILSLALLSLAGGIALLSKHDKRRG